MATNLALQLQVIEPDTDLNSIMIGNSRYSDDVWDLRPFITAKSTKESQKYIRFEYISDADMKETVKQYAYYKLGKTKPKTVRDYINGSFPMFIEYCSISGIHSFEDVTLEDYLNFNLWMKDEKKVATGTGFISCHVVEEIIRIGQIKGWNVPQFHLPKTETANQLWNRKKSMKTNKTKPIPEDVFDKILYHAVHDEKDVLTKAGIIIQSQTGLRINEVLSIQEGCVKHTSDGYDYMEVTLGKTEKGEPIIHKVFINDLVKDAITELSEYTAELRKESGLKELFIFKHGKIRPLPVTKWTENRLPTLIRRYDIRDNKGELYPLTSHQFRATFVRELIKRKVPIAMIMKQYSHVSIEMTAHYLTLQEEEVKEIYSDMILSPESKIAGLRAKEIIDKGNKAIDKLKRKNKPINFETVCKEAGVSRATLYNNAQLKERILSLRAISKASPLDDVVAVKKDKIQLKDDKIASLREQVKKLEDDKKKLIVQLVDYEELKSENERLKKQLAKK